jgi:hypothetical protein
MNQWTLASGPVPDGWETTIEIRGAELVRRMPHPAGGAPALPAGEHAS